MSGQIKIVVLEILKNKGPNEYLVRLFMQKYYKQSVDDIVDKIKKDRRFTRLNEKALRINITSIINEIKKQNKASEPAVEPEAVEKTEKDTKVLGRKRFGTNIEGIYLK